MQAALKLQKSACLVLNRDGRMYAVGNACLNRNKFVRNQPAKQVKRMNRLIDNHAAALFVKRSAPVARSIIRLGAVPGYDDFAA